MERYNNQTLKRVQKDGTDDRESVNIVHIIKYYISSFHTIFGQYGIYLMQIIF